MPSLAGQKLDKYDMLEEVGHGGMAVVYRGRDTVLDREVAVKVLHAHLADREESRRRLQREAKTVAKLHHDNIVEIFDSSDPTSTKESYIVCEFIHGETLRDWIDAAHESRPVIAAMITHRLCLPLDHAHSLGIVHRDIKPENVMIRTDGCLKLMDFGIAQILDTQRLTTTGQLLGSPAYMAPELISGKPVDKRIDIFALGVMLYQLSTGELPFAGRNPAQVLNRILEGDYKAPGLVDPRVDGELEGIIAKALARSPADRYQTAAALAKDLEYYLANIDVEASVAELAKYFDGPAAYVPGLDDRVCRALTRKAAQAMRDGNGARALKLLGRVLEINPDDTRAAAMLDRVRVRGQRMRQATGAAGLLAFVGIVAAGVMLLRPEPPTPGELDSEDPATNGAFDHVIPTKTPSKAPPVAEGETGTDTGETGETETDTGGSAPNIPNRVQPWRPSTSTPFSCTVRIDGLPAAVLAGGDYSLDVGGVTKSLPSSGEIVLNLDKRTKVELKGTSYEGGLYLDAEPCQKEGKLLLRARTKPATLDFQAGAIPLDELGVTCTSGCNERDEVASQFPALPFPKDQTEMNVTLVFKAKHYRELSREFQLYPGRNKVLVSLEPIE
ncbi:serine/threonine protein kinase [Plesiocystis pacifica SIR-1]|uniref:non-specific serine/threonine protein kinase n=1 Tax=Plesiocystis pacifica SIR-1 TaxID=391625 RepID=A6G4V4_9BACT|nr:serine/threonine-protein kinase [Plesiocystis pacifica]EDM79046.1 serine/threonine protein kinase [Plesiocystis pacifica SIR-1]